MSTVEQAQIDVRKLMPAAADALLSEGFFELPTRYY